MLVETKMDGRPLHVQVAHEVIDGEVTVAVGLVPVLKQQWPISDHEGHRQRSCQDAGLKKQSANRPG